MQQQRNERRMQPGTNCRLCKQRGERPVSSQTVYHVIMFATCVRADTSSTHSSYAVISFRLFLFYVVDPVKVFCESLFSLPSRNVFYVLALCWVFLSECPFYPFTAR